MPDPLEALVSLESKLFSPGFALCNSRKQARQLARRFWAQICHQFEISSSKKSSFLYPIRYSRNLIISRRSSPIIFFISMTHRFAREFFIYEDCIRAFSQALIFRNASSKGNPATGCPKRWWWPQGCEYFYYVTIIIYKSQICCLKSSHKFVGPYWRQGYRRSPRCSLQADSHRAPRHWILQDPSKKRLKKSNANPIF